MKLEFSQQIFEKRSNISPVGAKLFHTDRQTDSQTDGQTDITKLIITFHNFANMSKEWFTILVKWRQQNKCIPLKKKNIYIYILKHPPEFEYN